MLLELKSQRNELLSAKDLIDERRRFPKPFEGVTAGLSAWTLTARHDRQSIRRNHAWHSPKLPSTEPFGAFALVGRAFEIGRMSDKSAYREQLTFSRLGAERTYNIR